MIPLGFLKEVAEVSFKEQEAPQVLKSAGA
jgi:hypothetical protein